MSTEIDAAGDSEEGVQSEDVEELARQLGEAIRSLPEYERYEETKAAVERSAEAQQRIDEFEALRQDFMLARQLGEASQEDLQELQRTQRELHELPEMDAYLSAEDELNARLAAIDDAISDPIAVDFADEAGGCCHD